LVAVDKIKKGKAKGTWHLTKSQLLPNRRGQSITYIEANWLKAKGTW
jgi:hypothetical protein